MSTTITTRPPNDIDSTDDTDQSKDFYDFNAKIPFGTVVNYTIWCSIPFYKNIGMPRRPGEFHIFQWNEQINRFFINLMHKHKNNLWKIIVKNKHRRTAFINMDVYKKDFTNYNIPCPSGPYMNPYWVCHLFINELCRLDNKRLTDGKFYGVGYRVLWNSNMTIHFTW